MYDSLFKRKGLTLERLRKFLQVAESGSIAGAVAEAGSTQTAFSRDMRAMEEFFEQDLFRREPDSDRGHRLASLSPRGELLRAVVTDFFLGLEKVVDHEEDSPLIRIAAGETVLQWVLGAHLDGLRADLPNVRLDFSSGNSDRILDELERGRVDIGIVEAEALADAPADITRVGIGRLEYVLYASREMMPGARRVSEKNLLARLPMAAMSDLIKGRTRMRTEAGDEGYLLRLAVLVSSFPQLSQALRDGKLGAFLPTVAEGDMKELGLERVNLPLPVPLAIDLVLIRSDRMSKYRPAVIKAVGKIQTRLARDLAVAQMAPARRKR